MPSIQLSYVTGFSNLASQWDICSVGRPCHSILRHADAQMISTGFQRSDSGIVLLYLQIGVQITAAFFMGRRGVIM